MPEFMWPTGPISVRMTSDLLFKHLLQDSEAVLRALICSLLHLEPAQINKTEVTNPILLGQEIDEKTVILDVNVRMNDNTNIDLEMQVIDHRDWTERSVFYAARNFGDLKSGDPYLSGKPSIHIGFLAFSPFKEYEKFYSMNRLMDMDDHHVYTEKLSVGFVDLTRIDLATGVDKKYNMNYERAYFASHNSESNFRRKSRHHNGMKYRYDCDKWAKFFRSDTFDRL